MKSHFKKGFTLVELLVVIAILAILATVSIVGYSSFTKKANLSNDNTVIAELNRFVDAYKATDNEIYTVTDAQEVLDESGFDLSKIKTSSKGYHYAYDIVADEFSLLDDSFNLVEGYSVPSSVSVNLFAFVTSENERIAAEEKGYSTYLQATFDGSTLTGSVTKGIDVGKVTNVSTINYVNTSSPQNVVIRTNTFGTKLTVNGYVDTSDNTIGDVVTHYGFAGLVEVTKVAMASYDEYGVVGRISATATGAIGHIDIKEGATVYQIEQLGGDSTKVSVDANATVYDINHEKVEGAIVETNSRFTETAGITVTTVGANGERIVGKVCSHECTEDVIDGQHVYEVCKTCGYTVIKVGTDKKIVADSSDNNVIIPKATYGTGTNQIASTDGNQVKLVEDENTETGYVEPEIESTPDVDPNQKIDTSCKHNFVILSSAATCLEQGETVYECDKCGVQYSVNSAPLGHNFVNGICSRCQTSATMIHNAEELSSFVSNGELSYGVIANDFSVDGTVFCTRDSDFTIDFNGKTVNFTSEYVTKDSTKRGAFSIESGHTIILTDSSSSKTGKFINTATTTSGYVYLIGVYSTTNSSVVIDNLNVQLDSTSSSGGQIYGLVYSATSKKASNNVTIQNSSIELNANTGTSVGALVYGSYLKSLNIDSINVESFGSGQLIRLYDGALTSITNSTFDMESNSGMYGIDISGCGANSKIDNITINCSGDTINSVIGASTNATIKNSTINANGTKDVKGISISSGTPDGIIVENCDIDVKTTATNSSYKASGIYFKGDNHQIKDCNIVATNTGVPANAYAIEDCYYTTKNNIVQGGYYTGCIKGIGVVSGHYSLDPKEWVIEGYTSSFESNWYVVCSATQDDYVCVLTYTENEQLVEEKFNGLTNALNRIEVLKQKDDMLLTIKKDCSSTKIGASLYCDVVVEEDVNVVVGSLTPYINNPSYITITNNGNLTLTSGFSTYLNKKAVIVNNGTLNSSSLNVTNYWIVTNYGNITAKTITISGGSADKNGNKAKDSGTLVNNGTITILGNGTFTIDALTGYALNNTTDEVKATLYPVCTNNGSVLGTNSSSTLAVNHEINGTNSYQIGTYNWSVDEKKWLKGGKVENTNTSITYISLSDALSSANAGDTLKILDNLSLDGSFDITKNITIDLNGFELDFWNPTNHAGVGKAFTIKDNATLTIDDTTTNKLGKVKSYKGTTIWVQGNNAGFVLNAGTIEMTNQGGVYDCVIMIAGYNGKDEVGSTNGSVTINGGYVKALLHEDVEYLSGTEYTITDAIYIFGHNDATNMPTLTINGGEVSAYGYAIAGQGTYNNTVININGGVVISYESCAIYHPQYGELNISGTGVVRGLSAICLKGGIANISGGTIEATYTGTYSAPASAGNSGTNITGDALYIEDNYNRGIIVTITGGTFVTHASGAQEYRVLFSSSTPAIVNDNR